MRVDAAVRVAIPAPPTAGTTTAAASTPPSAPAIPSPATDLITVTQMVCDRPNPAKHLVLQPLPFSADIQTEQGELLERPVVAPLDVLDAAQP
ncbi:hypothetical protein GCM10010412_030640 [Nonomuraea recticatena]|uniref:Uncharacterized protein n=1 Tax=Nonomuraea recticatena TaxID=46178 RepID=A0ABN3RRL9_9ACTN